MMTDRDTEDVADNLRLAMRSVAASVAIITSYSGGLPVGITMTSVVSVSFAPPSLLICVNRQTRLHEAVLASRRFRVNFLTPDQAAIAQTFGRRQEGDKFDVGDWDQLAPFGPRLRGCLADICSELSHTAEAGSHSVFIARVREADHVGNTGALLYRDGQYARLG